MKLFLISLSFFTRIPVRIKHIEESQFYKSMMLIPFVGLIIGLILYFSDFIIKHIEYIPLQALILVSLYFIITGGLHYDGFGDSIDGLFSARDSKQALRIMKDPYLGSFGSLGVILNVLSFYVLNLYIAEHSKPVLLLLYPVIGRLSAIELGACFSPNPDNKGLGYHFCKEDNLLIFFFYLLVIGIILFFCFNTVYMIAVGLTLLFTLCAGWYIKRKIDGITGDILGLIIEQTQIVFLLAYTILESSFGN